jgi:DNA recombination protein RmuC
MFEVIFVLSGLIIGASVAWLLSANRTRSKFDSLLQEAQHRASTTEGKAGALEATLSEIREKTEQDRQRAAEDFEKLRVELASERDAKARAETTAKEIQERLEEERKLLEEAKEKLSDAFKALAGETLNNSSQTFLRLASETFNKILAEAKGDFGKRQEAIDGLIKPMSVSLKEFEEHVRQLEKSRESAYTGIDEHLKNLTTAQQQLQKETSNLVTALQTPQVRGQWGQMSLKRAVELAGMSEHCDFTEQVTKKSEEGTIRPDLVVHLPADREIVVDAKVSLAAYLNAISADTEEERKNHFIEHSRQIRAHMNNLGGKAYWQQFEKTPEFVVMFIPGESSFAAAAHNDLNLIEDGMQMRVVLATPTTIIALLRAVAFGWRQEQIAKSAQLISDMGKQLHERMRILIDHISGIGKGLERANSAYNSAVGSLEARVLPSARRFKDLGVAPGEEIVILEQVETTPRQLKEPDQDEGNIEVNDNL